MSGPLEAIVIIFSWEIIKRTLHHLYWWWEWSMGRADILIIGDMKFRIRATNYLELQDMKHKILKSMED